MINQLILIVILFYNAIFHPSLSSNFNFVVLGLDPRNDSLEKTETTDTVIVGRLTPMWNINLVSIPRDLWIYQEKQKINQIYPQSLLVTDKFKYLHDKFSQITNQNINRTVIITTQNIIKLTDILGGIDVNLQNGFIDNQYPNSEYILYPNSKIPKYKTVEFKSGPVHLDKDNITEFIRSRKSETSGTDIGRIERQQLVIEGLVNKLKSPETYKNKQKIIDLYRFYKNDINSNFSDLDILSLGIKILPQFSKLSINKFTIPTAEYPKTNIIYHPRTFINNQWVFIPEDGNYLSFQKFIEKSLSY